MVASLLSIHNGFWWIKKKSLHYIHCSNYLRLLHVFAWRVNRFSKQNFLCIFQIMASSLNYGSICNLCMFEEFTDLQGYTDNRSSQPCICSLWYRPSMFSSVKSLRPIDVSFRQQSSNNLTWMHSWPEPLVAAHESRSLTILLIFSHDTLQIKTWGWRNGMQITQLEHSTSNSQLF